MRKSKWKWPFLHSRFKNLGPLLNTNIPLTSRKYGLRNHFWALESRFLMRKLILSHSIWIHVPTNSVACPSLSQWLTFDFSAFKALWSSPQPPTPPPSTILLDRKSPFANFWVQIRELFRSPHTNSQPNLLGKMSLFAKSVFLPYKKSCPKRQK